MPVSLTLSRIGDGGLWRFFGSLGLVARHTPLAMKWSETSAAVENGMLKRSLLLHLANIPPGRYRLRLQVQTGAGPAVTSKEIDIL
jgi:hypothetical protein